MPIGQINLSAGTAGFVAIFNGSGYLYETSVCAGFFGENSHVIPHEFAVYITLEGQIMADPLSLIALGAAVGGASGKFVEKAWDSGEKWIKTYFEDHQKTAQIHAKKNAEHFLIDLANRVAAIEKQRPSQAQSISEAQDHPDFSALLYKATISAAQTDSQSKHNLLSRIVAERLSTEPESLLALTSKIACDVVSSITEPQIRALALCVNITHIGPSTPVWDCGSYFENQFFRFAEIKFTNLDLIHLEALSCLKVSHFLGRDLAEILRQKNKGSFSDSFLSSKTGAAIHDLWKGGLQSVDLTTVGLLIGIMATDNMTGQKTSLSGFQ